MKRNKPLTRKAPMRSRTPLKGGKTPQKPLESPRSPVPRAKAVNPVSDKARSFKPLDDMARSICKRNGVCEGFGILPGSCSGPLEWAHMIRRDQIASRWRQDNCKCLCKAHHEAVTKRSKLWWSLFSEDHYYYIKNLSMGMPTDQFVEAERERLKRLI